jgi:hypothetical protein
LNAGKMLKGYGGTQPKMRAMKSNKKGFCPKPRYKTLQKIGGSKTQRKEYYLQGKLGRVEMGCCQ